MIAYHLCSTLLAPGSIIESGNWGRMLMLYSYPIDNMESANLLLKEYIFESVRKAEYSDFPSRLKSVFCCPTLESAIMFREKTKRFFDNIYKVDIQENGMIKADISLTELPKVNIKNSVILLYEVLARQYWNSAYFFPPENNAEILTPFPCTVLEKVDETVIADILCKLQSVRS